MAKASVSESVRGATHKLKLRTGRSLWQSRRVRIPPHRKLTQDITTDVLIVGAGISGAMVADALTDAGFDVVIVDRRAPLAGSTPASTALLQYEIDKPLSELSRAIGKERAQRIWQRSRLAVNALRERARYLDFDIAAELEERDSLYLAGNVLDEEGLHEECAARREAGFEVNFLTKKDMTDLFGIRRAALLSFNNLSADPRQLAAGFLAAAVMRKARIYAPVEITDIAPGARRVRAASKDGPTITASHLIFATGYELPKGIPQKGHKIASTWAIATRPQPRAIWPGAALIWESSDPYLYLRAGPKGEIICGGEDEKFEDEAKRDALMPDKIAAIEKKLAKLMPWVDPRARYAWCANFGTSVTGSPSIGAVPGMPNCFAMLGYGGNGITFSMLGAQLLRTKLTGGTDPDAGLFSFRRSF